MLNIDLNNVTLEELDGMRQEVMKKRERDKCIAMHHNKVTHSEKDGYWRTRVPTEKGLKQIVKRDEKEFWDAVASHYQRYLMRKTVKDVFEEWIAEKERFEEITPSSITRYKTNFKRFFPISDPFCEMSIEDINDSDLELFIKRSIKDHGLTRKTFAGLVILLNGILKFAKREGYTTYSISTFMGDLSLPDSIFAKRKKRKDEEEVFSEEESELLLKYLWENPSIRNLGIILMFQTGMRVGELTALRWNKYDPESLTLEIAATEVSYNNADGKRVIDVQDNAKTDDGNRIIYLPQQAKKTLDCIRRLNPFGDFILWENGRRIRSKSINYHLKKACEEIGIPPRTTHKIRKTYASTLIINNVDDKLIQNQLGHSDIATTRQYYEFSTVRNKSKIQRKITDAIGF